MMPPKNLDRPNKRPRLETAPKFVNSAQIRTALQTDSAEGLTSALTSLRNQLTIKPQESAVSPQDERLSIVKQWMESSVGAYDLFMLWDKATLRESGTISLIVSIISSILSLLSAHYNNHALGQPVMKALLTPSRLRHLNSYIGGSNNELVIVTLKLFNVMSSFASGRDRKAVLEGFGWEIKSLPRLLNMRRKTHGEADHTDPLLRPDIRTLYVQFLLSFVDVDCPTQTKSAFLEQHREPFLAIFKGIGQDHYSFAKKILEVCWAGIWSDAKLKRTLKVGLFNEFTIGHIIKLYERIQPEGEDQDHIPANLVHHFLLAICTRPGTGICFKDRGWYPREAETDDAVIKDEDDGKSRYGKIYNKILSNILKTLKVNEDSRQQELAIKILTACPELVSGYWSAVALTLEPRLSSKWITNIAVFGTIISLPVPTSNLYLPNSQHHQPTPPPLSTVMENILPSVNTKNNFSKGLQSPSGLVQHCTALALARCLIKYQTVRDLFHKIAVSLEEDKEEGQWFKRCRELEREVRRRVPDFQVVVGFSQQKHTDPKMQPNSTKIALLAESAQRLLWLYHHCLPSVVAEVRFDVGKLLQGFSQEAQIGGADEEEKSEAASRLYRIQQLHILSLLKDSDQFVWTSKIASLSQTPFYILLAALSSASIPAIRSSISSLLQHILSQSILFQEDKNEPELWLNVLPHKRPVQIGPDDPLFQGETDGVVTFLDDCVQRCLKTPYRYVEVLHALIQSTGTATVPLERLEIYPSPLLMTVVEQLDAKINNKSLAASHLIGVMAFLRKLILNLAGKTTSLEFLRTYANRIETVVAKERLSYTSPELSKAVERELDILRSIMLFSSSGRPAALSNSGLESHLQKAENLSISDVEEVRNSRALNLIDWMRTLEAPLATHDLRRIVAVVSAHQSSKIRDVVENLVPKQASLWEAVDMRAQISDIASNLTFSWLYIHTDGDKISDDACQTILVDSIFSHSPTFVDVTRSVYLILHFITSSLQRDDLLRAHVSLLARVVQRSTSVLSPTELNSLKEILFVHHTVLKDIMIAPSAFGAFQGGVQLLLQSSVDPTSESDRTLLSGITEHWYNVLKTSSLETQPAESFLMARMWIKYLRPNLLFDLLDHLETFSRHGPSDAQLEMIDAVLDALSSIRTFAQDTEMTLIEKLPQLIALRQILSNSTQPEEIIAVSIEASLPVGLNGCPLPFTSTTSSEFVDFTRRAEARWARRNRFAKVELDIRSFLQQDKFTASTVNIITGLLYRRSCSPDIFSDWFRSKKCLERDSTHIIPIIHAFLDSTSLSNQHLLEGDIWSPFVSKIMEVLIDRSRSSQLREQAQQTLVALMKACGPKSPPIFATLEKELEVLSDKAITTDLLSAGFLIASSSLQKTVDIVSSLVDKGMRSCINNFSEGQETPEERELTETLALLVQESRSSKAHIVETLITVIIQNRFSSVSALRLAIACLSTCQLKPLIVNRYLQAIIQHPQFFKNCLSTTPGLLRARDAIVDTLHCLFNLHPTNTCQVTHIEPLIKIYRGTLSNSDLRILSIFQLFEAEKKLSVAPLLSRWSFIPTTVSQTSLEAILSLDPVCVLRTCINFPRWRSLEDQSQVQVMPQESSLYDPVFLMLLFSQMLSDHPPVSAFEWIEFFRTNVPSLFVRALSSKNGLLRDLAMCQVVALWKSMQTADLQEQPHVIYILNLLKDLMPTPVLTSFEVSEPPRRLPTYTTLLLMHSLRAIFHPSNFIYPITARFLLQRPTLDVEDVPMLYGLLYSSADESWKKERAWIIKFLGDGMVSSEDWRVLKRRHTWDLLASIFQSSKEVEDAPLRMAILEVLANLTCNMQATTSLVLKSALLPWIEMQLLQSSKTEGVEWIKILENIAVVVDANKIESSTNGEWRVIISRCLSYLIDENICSTAHENFPHAVPLIFRLASLNGKTLPDLPPLLSLAMICLRSFEETINVCENANDDDGTTLISYAPHRSFAIHQRFSSRTLNDWGILLELLWTSSMTLATKCDAWEGLTSRMLLWRGHRPRSQSLKRDFDVVEWSRKEVVYNLQ